jgi:hypothetical protein
MHKGLSGLHKCFAEKKSSNRLLQAVVKVKYLQRIVWKMAELCSLAMFLSLTSRQPSLSYSL